MREIDTIIVHGTATFVGMDITADTVRHWHVEENGWDDIGYHALIKRDGVVEVGRPDDIVGAHAYGYNKKSLGVAMAGGKGVDCKPEFNYTAAQMKALEGYCVDKKFKYNIKNIIGHNQVSSKACPCFNVEAWAETIGN